MSNKGLSDDTSDSAAPLRLPDVLPVFPLAGVLLLPGARLPLNIFKPRYRNMVEDALGSGRYIGMVQPRMAGVESPEGEPEIYEMGCAGRIVSFSETGDGRFVITLMGVCRFNILEEMPLMNGFRCIVPDFGPFAADMGDDQGSLSDRAALIRTVQAYFAANGIDVDWKSVESADDTVLVTTLSMLCQFEASERQALLECAGTTERGTLLSDLMTLSLHGDNSNNTVRH